MRQVFADTWVWVAVYDGRDAYHIVADTVVRDLMRDGVALVTTNAVLYESYSLLRRHAGLRAALALIDRVAAIGDTPEVLTVVRVDPDTEHVAAAIFRRYDDKDFSFVDCLSFAVMQQRGVTTALTGDRHFAQMGFEMVPEIDA